MLQAEGNDIPEIMLAIAISQFGPPEVLQPEERPVPVPESHEILIKVMAAGINRPDILQRQGVYRPPKGASDLPGLEVSGIVVKCGDNAKLYAVGDRVCALTPGGGYAVYVAVPEVHALPIPSQLNFIEAACLPEACFTVWYNVFERCCLRGGETLLVHGGASGIGTTAIQMAKARGSTVITTAGSERKCKACRELGADYVVNYHKQDYVAEVKQFTNGRGADVILDMVGGDYIERNYKAAAMDGRIIQIAFLKGAKVEVDFTRLMVKRLLYTGSTLRPQSLPAKAQIASDLEAEIWPFLEKGTIRPIINKVFPLNEAAAAHRYLESGQHIGKIALTVSKNI